MRGCLCVGALGVGAGGGPALSLPAAAKAADIAALDAMQDPSNDRRHTTTGTCSGVFALAGSWYRLLVSRRCRPAVFCLARFMSDIVLNQAPLTVMFRVDVAGLFLLALD